MKWLVLIAILFIFPIALAIDFSIIASVTINPIYDLDLEIEIINEKVTGGDDLNVSVILEKNDLINIAGEITIDLNYEIVKAKKFVIKQGYADSIDITDHAEKIIQISTIGINPGKYTLRMNATHAQAYSSQDEDKFVVKRARKGLLDMILSFLGF